MLAQQTHKWLFLGSSNTWQLPAHWCVSHFLQIGSQSELALCQALDQAFTEAIPGSFLAAQWVDSPMAEGSKAPAQLWTLPLQAV